MQLNYFGTKTRLKFRGIHLKQGKSTFNHGKIENGVNIFIVYELDKTYVKTHPMLLSCLVGAVSITKNADIDKNKYYGCGIGFDISGVFLLPDGSFGRNVVIFGVDKSSSVHVGNKGKGKDKILGTGPTQGLGEYSLTAEKMYSIDFIDHRKKCCLSLHYNEANIYSFVNGTEIIKFKGKDSKIIVTPLCLGNVSKEWSVDNMKDTGLNGYVYDFCVDCDSTDVDDIKDIHKYLMKKNNIV